MLSINTNLSSLIAQSSLKESTNLLNRAVERMTTGYKINGAKDNAANYSISTNMTTKINSYMVAEDNAAMGLDMVTSMASNLELIEDHTRRIRDLTEQAANGTYGEESLKAIQAEIDARLEEIERIKSSAEYNGVSLLESSAGGGVVTDVPFLAPVQRLTADEAIAQGYTLVTDETELVNALSNNESVCLMNDIDMTNTYSRNVVDSYSNATIEGNGYSIKNLKISGGNIGFSFAQTMTNVTINNLCLDYESTAGSYGGSLLFGIGYGNITVKNSVFTGDVYGQYGCNGLGGITDAIKFTMSNSYVNLSSLTASNHNAYYSVGLSSVVIDVENCYFNKDVINDSSSPGGVTAAELNAILAAAQTVNVGGGEKTVTLQVGINGDSNSQISFASSIALQALSIDCSDSTTARGCLQTLDDYLNIISAKQTELGAVTNRLESVLQEISIQYDNLVSSRSTLRDADIAKESSTYIQQQILQQASSTLLATANQSPSIALQLI